MEESPTVAAPKHEMLTRIRGEYLEMPGLRLTQAQAQRLWGLNAHTCASLLQRLIEDNFLCLRHDGMYSRLSDGEPALRGPGNHSHPLHKNSHSGAPIRAQRSAESARDAGGWDVMRTLHNE